MLASEFWFEMLEETVSQIVGAVLNDEVASGQLPLEVTDAMLGRKPKRTHLQQKL